MSRNPDKAKKLLYQLEHDLTINLDKPPYKGIFDDSCLKRFNQDIGVEGKKLTDTDCRLVVSFQQPSTIIVAKGYRWDGCSPKFHFLDLFWFGTPDGVIVGSERPRNRPDEDRDIPITHERVTHQASCVHDVLGYCKYDEKMPHLFRADAKLGKPESKNSLGRLSRDKLFREMLKMKGHSLWRPYYWVVSSLGSLFNHISCLNSANQPKSESCGCEQTE